MMTISQNPNSLFMTFIVDSILVCLFFILVWRLAVSIMLAFMGETPRSVPARVIAQAVKIGAAHGLTTCLLILYLKPQTPYAGAFVTFLATFIVSIPTIFLVILNVGSVGFSFSRLTIKSTIELIKMIVGNSLIFSVILAVPSFLLYFLTEKIRGLFFN